MAELFTSTRASLLELAEVACAAAEELDAWSQAHDDSGVPKLQAVPRVVEYLRSVSAANADSARTSVSSMKLALMRKAMIGDELHSQELATSDQVVVRAAELAGFLESKSSPYDEIAKMRDFCLALSQLAVAESRLRTSSSSAPMYKK